MSDRDRAPGSAGSLALLDAGLADAAAGRVSPLDPADLAPMPDAGPGRHAGPSLDLGAYGDLPGAPDAPPGAPGPHLGAPPPPCPGCEALACGIMDLRRRLDGAEPRTPCRVCAGSGRAAGRPCGACHASGLVPRPVRPLASAPVPAAAVRPPLDDEEVS